MVIHDSEEGAPPPPEVDELAAHRERRFRRKVGAERYACPSCGAHSLFSGLCLVCCDDTTQRIDDHGRVLPPPEGVPPAGPGSCET